jgi:hypothetical protein
MTAQEVIDYLKKFPANSEVEISRLLDEENELIIDRFGYVGAHPLLILETK